jgi:hypothetical protein
VRLTVNGADHQLEVEPRLLLVHALRDQAGGGPGLGRNAGGEWRGEPDLLAAEMARLRRSAHRLVWLNPLAADPAGEPLTRGMQAAIPHTDRLLPGNSLAHLDELAAILEEM